MNTTIAGEMSHDIVDYSDSSDNGNETLPVKSPVMQPLCDPLNASIPEAQCMPETNLLKLIKNFSYLSKNAVRN